MIDKIAQNFKTVSQQIAENCDTAVKIVAVTKSLSVETVTKLGSIGINCCGENRVQDFVAKSQVASDIDWHFIGRLQSNKIKFLVGKTGLIQSVDSQEHLTKISQIAKQRGVVCDILVQVNTDGDMNKGGVSYNNAANLVRAAQDSENINVKGLMWIPAIDNVNNQKYYLQTRELYDKLNNGGFKYLSMGMSGDYLCAVKCGATMVRLGKILFN